MKRIFAIIMSICLLGISGCTKPSEPTVKPVSDTPTKVEEKEVKKHGIVGGVDAEDLSKIGEFSYDFDDDGEEDLLEFFTSAAVVDGDIWGDDRNRWLVTVTTLDGVYKLYDDYIQLGDVEVEVGEFYNEDTDRAVIMTITSGAGKSITHFVYRDDVFIEETVYSTDDFSQNGASVFTIIR